MKPLKTFRIFIHDTTLFYKVFIWETQEQMHEYLKDVSEDNDFGAIVRGYEVLVVYPNGKTRLKPIMGEIHFSQDNLGTEIITHETVHAIFMYCRRIRCQFSVLNRSQTNANKMVGDLEEGIAYLQGKFNREMVSKLRKFKFIP